MAKTNAAVFSFSTGEMSRAALARIDQERVKLAAQIQENLFPHAIGKGQVRPGTGYICNTASNAQTRLISFFKSIDETAVLHLSNAKLRVQVDDALVTRASVTTAVFNGAFGTPSATVTITIASPGVVSWAGHPFTGSGTETVTFKTSGALPTGITAGTVYYVISTGLVAGTSFRISATSGGAAINTSGSQSGTHTGDAGWTTTVVRGGVSTIASNRLTIYTPNRGGNAKALQQVSLGSGNAGTEHALRIVVDRGPVTFRCGSTAGGDEYIPEVDLGVGTHSLAFTPSGAFWVQFFTKSEREVRVSSCTVEAAGILEFTAPWSASDLPLIRTAQSADVVYMACASWQQRKIERRGDTSWSLVKYMPEDGPFLAGQSADVILTAAAFSGNTTITADQPFFKAAHVGALLRLFHEGQNVDNVLAGDNVPTDTFKATGLGTSRVRAYTLTGTWAGSLSLERSLEGSDLGFAEVGTETTNSSVTTTDSTAYDNLDAWYRWVFRTGTYTSGAVRVQMTFDGGGGWGVARITAFNSATSVDVEVLTPFKSRVSTNWREGAWSDEQQWPSAVALFDGRLWWAGADQVWGSESDDFTAFNLDTVGDAGSIQRSIATGSSVDSVNWLLPLQRLLFGTDASEASARASSFDQPLTPTAFTLKDASNQGVAAVSPAKIDGRGVFVQRSSRKVYEIAYDLQKQDYGASCLSKFHEEIGGNGLLEIAVQRQPQSYIWFVRDDGQCPILLYDPGEQTAGWIRFIGAPSLAGVAIVESICVLPEDEEDAVYLAVKRTINGSTVRFVEKLRKHSEATGGLLAGVVDASVLNAMADAATLTAGPVSSVTLAHLASETGLVGWGTTNGVAGPITGLLADGSGVIQLGATYTNVWVGLKYDWRYQSAKLAYAAQGGTALLQRKRVTQVGFLAADFMYGAWTAGPAFGATGDSGTMDPLPLTKDGADVSQTTVYAEWDEPSFPFRGEWNTDSRLCLKGSAPYPATLLGLVVGVETHET